MQLIETKTGLKGRQRSIARARQSFIASKPRLGRIQLQVRRAFVSSSGRPLQISDLLPRVYPRLTQFESWHRWSIRRALLRVAVSLGRIPSRRGRPNLWAPKCRATETDRSVVVRCVENPSRNSRS
jgi:hypothetical protein